MKQLKIRGHHVYCLRYIIVDPNERGEIFYREFQRIRDILANGSDTTICIVSSIDDLCEVCPFCKNNACIHPMGDERDVQKLDSIILKSIDMSIGDVIEIKEVVKRVLKKTPIRFCQHCKAYKIGNCAAPIAHEIG